MPFAFVRSLVARSVAIATHKKKRECSLTGFTGENTRTKGERSDLADSSDFTGENTWTKGERSDLADPVADRRGSDWLSDVYSRYSQPIETSTADFAADYRSERDDLAEADRVGSGRDHTLAGLGGQGGRGSHLLTGVGKFPTGNRADSLFNKGGHAWAQ